MYKFRFATRLFQESTKSDSKTLARAAELKRRRELQGGYHGLKKRQAPMRITDSIEVRPVRK